MTINTFIPFEFFQVVYLITDLEQLPYQVIGLKICGDKSVLIEL